MRYKETVMGIFRDRPNRFIAHVEVDGVLETVHVKNTGRCKELLIPGVEVVLELVDKPERKTKFDLIAVKKASLGWINMDSQAPNKVVGEWLAKQGFDYVKPEFKYGNSRVDFYMEKGEKKFLMEIKGCTLEVEGQGYFPDAPTSRGTKHLRELIEAQKAGVQAIVGFVIQMPKVETVLPNSVTDKEFTKAFYEAIEAGVLVKFFHCRVETDELEVIGESCFEME